MPAQVKNDMSFTPNEVKLIVLCFKHTKSTPDIDFDAVAKDYGYSNTVSARNRFRAVKKRCKEIAAAAGFSNDEEDGDNSAGNDDNTPSKKKATAKKRKTAGDETGSGGKKNKTAASKHEDDDEDYSSSVVDSSPLGGVPLKYEDTNTLDDSEPLIKDEDQEEV